MEIRFAYLKISNTPEVMRCWISQTELNISSDETELPARRFSLRVCTVCRELGCRFTKWRMLLNIGENLPSITAVEDGAMYADICQRNG